MKRGGFAPSQTPPNMGVVGRQYTSPFIVKAAEDGWVGKEKQRRGRGEVMPPSPFVKGRGIEGEGFLIKYKLKTPFSFYLVRGFY